MGWGGYGTVQFGAGTNNFTNTITITFARPVSGVSFNLTGDPFKNISLTGGGQSASIVMAEDQVGYGFGGIGLVGLNTTSVTLSATDPTWNFAISDFSYTWYYPPPAPGSSPSPTPTPEPVVFVAGIAGSSLDIKGGENLWLGSLIPYATDRSKLTRDPNKTQYSIVAPDVIRQISYPFFTYEVYNRFLDYMTSASGGGYTEYQVNGDPTRRTTAGCDLTQQAKNPNLFVFAYDWRLSNATNADLNNSLADYIGCVQKFYPNTKVNIVAHSMGGLLARRYILDNPGNVDKLITVGSPWLGAPKAIFTLETGRFFDNPFYPQAVTSSLDKTLKNTFKDLVEFFPGVHELLPSRWYFTLGGQPFSRTINIHPTQTYDFDQLGSWLNQQHPRSTPATTGTLFHDYQQNNSLQDDWRKDQTGVQYYHIYGWQDRDRTIGQVQLKYTSYCRPFRDQGILGYTNRCVVRSNFEPIRTYGDGTVPLLSAQRLGNGYNLNSDYNDPNDPQHQHYFIVNVPPGGDDELADHNGMMKNPDVLAKIVQLLSNTPQPPFGGGGIIYARASQPKSAPFFAKASFMEFAHHGQTIMFSSKNTANFLSRRPLNMVQQPANNSTVQLDTYQPLPPRNSSYYVDISGIGQLTVKDAFGHTNTPIDDVFSESVPGVDIDPTGANSVQVVTPTTKEYTLTFKSTGDPMGINIIMGENNETPTQVIRYMDLYIPAGVTAMLHITPQGIENLRYDSAGDGTFATTVSPTVSATGAAAQDLDPPVIAFSESFQGINRLVTINATDSGSGVKSVLYSLDGTHFQPYTGPVVINPIETPILYAFADDNVANRSSVVTYKPLVPSLTLSRDSNTQEIIATFTIRNDSTGDVTANLILSSAQLGNSPTTTSLPISINVIAAGTSTAGTVRFPATAAVPGSNVILSGSGSENGAPFGGGIPVTVP